MSVRTTYALLALTATFAASPAHAGDIDRAVGIAHQVHPLTCEP